MMFSAGGPHLCTAKEGRRTQPAAYHLCSSLLVLHTQQVCSHTTAEWQWQSAAAKLLCLQAALAALLSALP